MTDPQPPESFLIPNALWGSFAFASGPKGFDRTRVRGRSPSFSDALVQRFIAACRSWGNSPPGLPSRGSFLQVPTRLDPQGSGPPSDDGSSRRPRRGVLAIAVRESGQDHAKREGALGFHGAFLSEDTFAAFEDQAHGLWRAGVFMESWDGDDDLPFLEIDRERARTPGFEPPPAQEVDVLVDELRHVLKGGDVVYNLGRPDRRSDEHLRLLQLGLPRDLKIPLGFCTFFGTGLHKRPTLRGDDAYPICAVPGSTAFEPGRATLLPPRRRPAGRDDGIESYLAGYREAVSKGDVSRLLQVARAGIPGKNADPTTSGGLLSWLRR